MTNVYGRGIRKGEVVRGLFLESYTLWCEGVRVIVANFCDYLSRVGHTVQILFYIPLMDEWAYLCTSQFDSIKRPLVEVVFQSLTGFEVPLVLLKYDLPVSSVVRYGLGSLGLQSTPSLGAFDGVVFVVTFAEVSIPSSPALTVFSVGPISLPFSAVQGHGSGRSCEQVLS